MTRQCSDLLRRVVDVCVAAIGLVVLAPVMVAISIAIRVVLGSPVLFRQTRLGRGGAPFDIVKFRTMHAPDAGPWDPGDDVARTPKLGRFLRSTSLDELPSLVNLLRGDITLVGPRPLPVAYWTRFRGDEYRRFDVLPGITGLAQVNGRNTVDWDERLALDVRYVRERSLIGDVRILLDTVGVVVRRDGIDNAEGVTMHALPTDRPER